VLAYLSLADQEDDLADEWVLAEARRLSAHAERGDLHGSRAAELLNPTATLSAWLLDPKMRQRYPGGYDQMVGENFARYRALGGTAASAFEIQPMKPPCAQLGARIPPPRPGMPVTDTATKATPVR
jgi:hypothetical protein